jgi:hypothetical protein
MKIIYKLYMPFIFIFFLLSLLLSAPLQGAAKFHSFTIKLKNSLNIARNDQLISLSLSAIKDRYVDFDENNFVMKIDGKPVPFDLVINNKKEKNILLQVSFRPVEQKQISFSYSNKKISLNNKRTRAYLGIKKNYSMKDGIYTGGNFESVNHAVVPKSHFPHDALYQMEGPAWESDKIAYRLYLDERNRTDIFGKSTSKLVLDIVGKNDLLSGNESYEYPLWWGQDVFKVGNSLGIGSVATYSDNKVVTVSGYDTITCDVFNNNVCSTVSTHHYGWKVGDNKFTIQINYSIFPGSRLTEVVPLTDKPIDNLCTGLAKHDSTEYLISDNKNGWNYMAVWGKQTICNDNLGIALFFNSKDVIKITEDNISRIVVLKPMDNSTKYYFAAAWEKEKNGIKTQSDFIAFLIRTIDILNNPVIVDL